jgi:hypothetical protein
VQHEAHAWWKAPLADEFHQLRVGAEFPTEPLSGTTELNVVIELLDVDDPRAKQTDGELEAWVIDDAPVSDEPVLIQSVNWTLETDEQELDLTIAIDTTGFTDGWHRLQLAGIITGDESFTRMVLLEASFASSNGNPVGSDVPRGPRASGLLADASAHTVGIVDIEILAKSLPNSHLSGTPTCVAGARSATGAPTTMGGAYSSHLTVDRARLSTPT